MKHKAIVRGTFCAAAAFLAGSAEAQLIIGNSERNEPSHLVNLNTIRPTNQYPVPVNIADSQPLFTSFSITGMAADDANELVYFVDFGTSRLYRFTYNNTASPVLMGIVRRQNANNDPISLQSLAIDTTTGALYGTYNVGGTPGEGIYRLNYENPPIVGGLPAIFVEQVLAFNNLPGGETAWQVQNLDYDPVTNKIYGINDTGGVNARGLYHFDLTGQSANLVVESPNYRRLENDFDGLATGDGKAYFVTDEPGFVYIYDLVNGGPFQDFLSPVLSSGLFAGAAYAPGLIPEPTILTTLAAAGLALLRTPRRRG